MPDELVSAILTMLVDLKAENLALWMVLDKAGQVPQRWPPPELAKANQMVHSIRAGLSSLPKIDPQQIAILLATLSRTQIR
jgi:hypothetical protein